uniref:Uncharacterized protein n=1 Tax=Lotharella oceanica TaxID=641309 RepID=A0A7S2TTP8_9EUKA|mmetsp:Transcript_27805/g.51916  ORF Transcript_27805/g.51916 Transcript_27805/m.51916 type:complete len:170 (+) Transcript_27805:35-544(+)
MTPCGASSRAARPAHKLNDRAGHVGIRFRDDEHQFIYGFLPYTPLLRDMGSLVDALLHGRSFPAFVSDNLVEFVDAASQSSHGLVFVFWDVQQGLCEREDCGLAQVRDDARQPRVAGKAYAFPPEAPRRLAGVDYSECDNTWGDTCFNCGTYPRSLGIPIPESSGMMDR